MGDPMHYLLTDKEPVRLPLDKHIFFGRSEGNNIVVDDMRASRRHAELYWDGSTYVLIDLNSSNGTRVNDQNISTRVLKDGDEIQIGLVSYKYRVVGSPEDLETTIEQARRNCSAMVTAEMPALSELFPDTDFNGTIGAMTVTEICQTLQLGQRTGLLRIRNEKKEKGLLYFRDGTIQSAEFGLTLGDEAAMKILKTKAGVFSFVAQAPALSQNVKTPTPHLLLDAARQRDEDGR